ncbi:hypothetical protein K470DRAFT_255457 [Piedraia hortae CBS 480.64]|uniref:Secreted protein n=1 Tax=Piedraia hortae CBS 480.64 TaxID=1314780 RepID=A0A6A7C673_9PEZI|nr:hypothetical protein K470DRAFT_255457 [Piedraia hortae CBS 480.64]
MGIPTAVSFACFFFLLVLSTISKNPLLAKRLLTTNGIDAKRQLTFSAILSIQRLSFMHQNYVALSWSM